LLIMMMMLLLLLLDWDRKDMYHYILPKESLLFNTIEPAYTRMAIISVWKNANTTAGSTAVSKKLIVLRGVFRPGVF
jgi:hypothetical protein